MLVAAFVHVAGSATDESEAVAAASPADRSPAAARSTNPSAGNPEAT